MNKQWLQRRRGFTLIELMVAVTIVAVLSAAGFVSYTQANVNARDGKRKSDLEQVRMALELYRTNNTGYPSGTWSNMMSQLTGGSYLTSTIQDPKNVSPYQYSYSTSTSGACSGRAYQVCARLEKDGTNYCLCSP